MEDIESWEAKFESCQYSDKLINKLLLLNTKAKNPVDIQEVKKAIYYAKKYHGDQMRESGEVYYSHPIEVAYMVSDYLFRTDVIVTAILHDTIEDTKLTEEMIAVAFGGLVASQVEDLTRVKAHKKITSKEQVQLVWYKKNKAVLLIKIIDRIHNLQTIETKSPEKIKKIVEETFRYFISISIYCELKPLEKILTDLCYKYLLIAIPKKSTAITLSNNYQLPSLTFQNDKDQKHILYLLES